MPKRFLALHMCAAFAFIVFCTPMALAQTNSDAMQIVTMTTSMLAKELKPGSPEAHVTKVALSEGYALALWQSGHVGGEKVFQKKFGIGWVPLGGGGGEITRASGLASYGVPSAMATALIAGMNHCLSPQKLTFHGRQTSVCFVGPCKVC